MSSADSDSGPDAPAHAPLSIAQIAVNVRDLERATAFYRDVVGLPFLFAATDMAFFDCGGVRLMLARPSEARFDHPASVLYYTVADVDKTWQACVARGAAVEREPQCVHSGEQADMWMGFLRDTEDNVLALVEQRPHA
jgi:methylmalonyl-CoA/ethylmalonyl-CoA epimerase